MGIGRPSEFSQEHLDQLNDLGHEGETKTEMAVALGIARDTLYRWDKEHPDFSDALKRAVERSQAWWERTLRRQAHGLCESGASATAAIFAMKNQFRDDYKDRHDVELDARVGTFEIDYTGNNFGHTGSQG